MQIKTFSGNRHRPPVQISLACRKLMSVCSLLLFEGSAAEAHTCQSSWAEQRPLKHNSAVVYSLQQCMGKKSSFWLWNLGVNVNHTLICGTEEYFILLKWKIPPASQSLCHICLQLRCFWIPNNIDGPLRSPEQSRDDCCLLGGFKHMNKDTADLGQLKFHLCNWIWATCGYQGDLRCWGDNWTLGCKNPTKGLKRKYRGTWVQFKLLPGECGCPSL